MEILKGHIGISDRILDSLRDKMATGVYEGGVEFWSDDVRVLSEDGREYWMELTVRSNYFESVSGLYPVHVHLVVWDDAGDTVSVYGLDGNQVRYREFVSFSKEFEVITVDPERTFKLEIVKI